MPAWIPPWRSAPVVLGFVQLTRMAWTKIGNFRIPMCVVEKFRRINNFETFPKLCMLFIGILAWVQIYAASETKTPRKLHRRFHKITIVCLQLYWNVAEILHLHKQMVYHRLMRSFSIRSQLRSVPRFWTKRDGMSQAWTWDLSRRSRMLYWLCPYRLRISMLFQVSSKWSIIPFPIWIQM